MELEAEKQTRAETSNERVGGEEKVFGSGVGRRRRRRRRQRAKTQQAPSSPASTQEAQGSQSEATPEKGRTKGEVHKVLSLDLSTPVASPQASPNSSPARSSGLGFQRASQVLLRSPLQEKRAEEEAKRTFKRPKTCTTTAQPCMAIVDEQAVHDPIVLDDDEGAGEDACFAQACDSAARLNAQRNTCSGTPVTIDASGKFCRSEESRHETPTALQNVKPFHKAEHTLGSATGESEGQGADGDGDGGGSGGSEHSRTKTRDRVLPTSLTTPPESLNQYAYQPHRASGNSGSTRGFFGRSDHSWLHVTGGGGGGGGEHGGSVGTSLSAAQQRSIESKRLEALRRRRASQQMKWREKGMVALAQSGLGSFERPTPAPLTALPATTAARASSSLPPPPPSTQCGPVGEAAATGDSSSPRPVMSMSGDGGDGDGLRHMQQRHQEWVQEWMRDREGDGRNGRLHQHQHHRQHQHQQQQKELDSGKGSDGAAKLKAMLNARTIDPKREVPIELLQEHRKGQRALAREQEAAITAALAGRNIFLTGSAGVGKSYTLQQIVTRLQQRHKKVYVTATTGVCMCVCEWVSECVCVCVCVSG